MVRVDAPRGRGECGRVAIRGIHLEARHGVLPVEAERLQPFLVDVELELDLARAAREDDLGATVDYAAVAAVVAEVLGGPRRRLLESLAGAVAAALRERFPAVRRGWVEVHKPSAPVGLPFADVSVRYPFHGQAAGGARGGGERRREGVPVPRQQPR